MTTWTDESLLEFLEGRMPGNERKALLDALDADPELSRRLRDASAGIDLVRAYAADERVPVATPPTVGRTPGTPSDRTPGPTYGSQRWWVAAAVAATLVVSVPSSIWIAGRAGTRTPTTGAVTMTGIPQSPAPSFVLVLHGRWPDVSTVTTEEQRRRAAEYWAWTSELADRGVLLAAGDLVQEPGARFGPSAIPITVAATEPQEPDFLVGMFALRVDSYEQARAIAAECPHLRYGGTVSVRQVGMGFVTPGTGDWTQ